MFYLITDLYYYRRLCLDNRSGFVYKVTGGGANVSIEGVASHIWLKTSLHFFAHHQESQFLSLFTDISDLENCFLLGAS